MKHIYNPTKAAHTQRPSAKASGTAAVSKIFMFMLLSFFLLVSGESFGQTITDISPKCIVAGQDVTLTISGDKFSTGNGNLSYVVINGSSDFIMPSDVTKNSIVVTIPGYRVTSGILRINIKEPNNKVSNIWDINAVALVGIPGQSCEPGSSVVLSATGASNGSYRWYNSAVGGDLLGNQSTLTINSLQTTTTYYVSAVSNGCETARIPVKAIVGNILPTVIGDGRCDPGQVVLKASGKPTGGDYLWYRTNTSSNILGTGETYTISNLGSNATYYVSIINADGCESARVPVEARIGNPSAPTVTSDGDCGNGNQIIILTANGAVGNEVYRWYSVATGGEPISTGKTLPRNRNNQTGTYYVSIYNEAGLCEGPRTRIDFNTTAPIAPSASISGNRCGAGTVVLSAEGAGPTESYRWYTAQSNGTLLGQGMTFTTEVIPAGTTRIYYVSKVSIMGCDGARIPVTATAAEPGAIDPDPSIIYPLNSKVGEPAVFGFNSNFAAIDIESYKWYYHEVGSDANTWVVSTNTPNLVFSSMPNNIDGVKVELKIKEQNAACYANVPLSRVYTIIDASITPLPVELMFFRAQAQTKGVSLTWATASELENKGFEVQVSSNGRDFSAIGFVESKVGTTAMRQDYDFLDTKAVSGTRYYRLKQVDFDGTTSFSPIRAVALNSSNARVSAYPNPFDDAVVVTLNGTENRSVQVILMDASGKVLQQRTEETMGNSITVDMRSVTAKGMYVLHVLDNDTKHTFKLMKR